MDDTDRPRILIIDDEVDWRSTLRMVLMEREWDVEEARDGAEALRLLRQPGAPAPDAIICDVRMPGPIDGPEFCSRLLSARPEMFPRLVLYSSALEKENVQAFLAHTPIRALSKCASIDALLDTIEQAMSPLAEEAPYAYVVGP